MDIPEQADGVSIQVFTLGVPPHEEPTYLVECLQ
jgi:hypothetical protein